MWPAGQADDKQRFLADMRALRDEAALGYDELAARTHYPDDILKDAESGPSLPGLPVLAAYVRACEGDVPAWEERWRRLGFDAPRGDADLPARAPGASPAAVAGARASAGVAPPDAYNPEHIRAVLRGISQAEQDDLGTPGRTAAAAFGPAGTGIPAGQDFATSWSAEASRRAGSGWDAVPPPERAGAANGQPSSWDAEFRPDTGPRWDDAAANGNGNGYVGESLESFTRFSPPPEPGMDYGHAAEAPRADYGQAPEAPAVDAPAQADADTVRRDQFPPDWRQDREAAASRPLAEPGWPDQSGTVSPATDSWFAPHRSEAPETSRFAADGEGSPESWFTPRERADLSSAQSLSPETAPPPAQEQPAPPTSWSGTVETPGAIRTPPEHEAPRQAAAELQTPAREAIEPVTSPRLVTEAPAPRPAPEAASMATVPAAERVPAELVAAEATTARASAEPESSARTDSAPRERRRDRMFPVRLLVVIVVAALIGSVLVLLLR